MNQIQERPFATRTEGELVLMSEFLEREIRAMNEKNALVQAEMQFRAQAQSSGAANGPIGTARANDSTLDSYEDQAKAYAIRTAVIGIGVIIAAAAVVWFVARATN